MIESCLLRICHLIDFLVIYLQLFYCVDKFSILNSLALETLNSFIVSSYMFILIVLIDVHICETFIFLQF